jgi:ABC exporter DevB family membrane fusion protein
MKKRTATIAALMAGVGLAATVFLMSRSKASPPADVSAPRSEHSEPVGVDLVAGPGRVEPLSEDIKVGSEISGKLKSVLVEEGDHVRRGQVLAILQNDDYRAQVASAEAGLAEKEAALRKTVNGARSEERREALAAVNEAQAIMENARAEMERRQRLYRDGVVSREEVDRYEREFKVAEARHHQAAQHYALLDDPAREEDCARGEADVALARAQLDEARARYEKTFVRSPIDGVVLRKHHRPGESVTNSSTSADPVVTLGDERVLRVRVDVDENDVAKVRLGDRAYVTADAYPGRKFWGKLVRIGQEMGPKNLRTDEPTERVDKKILETLIQLDSGHELPVGLRVDSFILVSQSSEASPSPGGH